MLRSQATQRREHSDGDELDEGVAAVEVADSSPRAGDSVDKEFRQTDETFLWLLLLAAAAECVTTCFWPAYTLPRWGLNAGATALNLVGPFLDGMSYGYQGKAKDDTADASVACLQFRSSFLGVFTSYSFMADHAGDLSATSFAAGPLYICISILGGCTCFYLGKQFVQPVMASPPVAKLIRVVSATDSRPSLVACTTAFVLLTTVRAALGPYGFVRDPNDPQFLGSLKVADGEELVLGILMSCSAVLLSDYLCAFFPQAPSSRAMRNGVPFIDWGCLCCNLLACLFTGLTYQLSLVSTSGVTNNLLALKFVASFCGSLSSFNGAVNVVSRLWLAGNRQAAIWNLCLQLLVALLFIPYLYKREAN